MLIRNHWTRYESRTIWCLIQ